MIVMPTFTILLNIRILKYIRTNIFVCFEVTAVLSIRTRNHSVSFVGSKVIGHIINVFRFLYTFPPINNY